MNENHTIRFRVSNNPTVVVSSSYLQKCGILHFLPQERSVFLFLFCLFFFFIKGDHIHPVGLGYREMAHSNGNEKF